MAQMKRDDMRTNLALMLSVVIDAELSQAELNRAIEQAVGSLSRFFPRELVFETTFIEQITNEQFTASDDTAVTLSNKPVRRYSEVVTFAASGGTLFVRDTDYTIDYINGTITTLSSGSIVNAATTYINYKMDSTQIDLGTNLTKLISIIKIETFKTDQVPQVTDAWEVHGDFLYIKTQGHESEQRLPADTHIRVYYMAAQDNPTDSAAGTYPEFLDEVVLMGASGYALLMESLERQQEALVDLASSRTALALSDDDIPTGIGAITLASTDLTSARAELTAADVPLDTDVDSALDRVVTELDLANLALDKITVELESGTADDRSADYFLDQGDATINKVNVGGLDTPRHWAEYGQVKVAIANGLIAEAAGRLAHGRAIIEEGVARIAHGAAFVSNAMAYMQAADRELGRADRYFTTLGIYLQQSTGYQNTAEIGITSSNLLRLEANSRLAAFFSTLQDRAQIGTHGVQAAARQYAS